MQEISRNDSKYLEIENLEDYEITSSMLYEMYIRKIGEENGQVTNGDLLELKSIKIKDVILYKSSLDEFTLQNVIYSIFPNLLDDAKAKLIKEYKSQEEDFISAKLSSFSFDLEYLIKEYIEKIDSLDSKGKNIINFQTIVYKDGITNTYITITKDILKEKINLANNVPTVYPTFKRPQLYLKENYFVHINYLNLALPDKELFSFIKKLKEKVKKESIKINSLLDNDSINFHNI